jgi:hypothetical protein
MGMQKLIFACALLVVATTVQAQGPLTISSKMQVAQAERWTICNKTFTKQCWIQPYGDCGSGAANLGKMGMPDYYTSKSQACAAAVTDVFGSCAASRSGC